MGFDIDVNKKKKKTGDDNTDQKTYPKKNTDNCRGGGNVTVLSFTVQHALRVLGK